MQCILREKLLKQGLRLSEISTIYRTDSSRFVESYFQWLDEAEKDLSGLRSPIGILLQSEKTSLTAVMDGYLPSNVQEGKSIRKIQKTVAAQSLEKISQEIYTKIATIDNTLEQLSEKMCHAIAVLASKEPNVYDHLDASQQSIDMLWGKLGKTPETIPMFNYFCAKLAVTDTHYLLLDIIQKVIGNRSGGAHKVAHRI